ncbi:hypothetical protein I3760_13G158400 [Carya illinoinensis]|nr:hypothetical protein I3760_13G158400 [Carya illinoinensis]
MKSSQTHCLSFKTIRSLSKPDLFSIPVSSLYSPPPFSFPLFRNQIYSLPPFPFTHPFSSSILVSSLPKPDPLTSESRQKTSLVQDLPLHSTAISDGFERIIMCS